MDERTAATRAATENNLLEIDLSTLFKAVWRRLPLCVVICTVVVGLALAYCYLSTPVYVGRTRMLIEPGSLKVTEIQDVYNPEISGTSGRREFFNTQIQLITSKHILAKVFEHFRQDPHATFVEEEDPLLALAQAVEISQVRNTSLVDIGFCSEDPSFAAEVSNFLARTYMEDSSQRSTGFSQLGLERLQDELLNMEQNRLKAIDLLNSYKTKHDILSVESQQNLGIARLTELDRASIAAREAQATARAAVDAIAAWRAAGKPLDSLPDVIGNQTLAAYKTARLQAQGALIKTLQDFGHGHKSVSLQHAVLRDIDKAIEREIENSLTSATARLEQTTIRVRLVEEDRRAEETKLRNLDKISDEYRMLEDNLRAAENAYQFVLQRVNELQIARSADSGSGGTNQILVPATPPTRADYPKKVKILIIAALAAGVGSVLLCIALELLDSTLKRREDVESIAGIPVYGFIPHADGDRTRPDLASVDKPQGQLAEAFRALRTSLSLSVHGRTARILAITSSMQGEGKSFTALNLAVTYARAGKRVLLLDGDLRKHRLTRLLHTETSPKTGLSNILAGDVDLAQLPELIRQPFPDLPLDFLGAGQIPPNPAELLGGDTIAPLLDSLQQQYDMIIIDVPPILAVSDARTLAALPALSFLVVVRMLVTEKKQLAITMDALRTVGARVLGTVMNNAEIRSEAYYGHGYGYGYRYYSYGYGKDSGKRHGRKRTEA